jgi:ferredoxin
MTLEVEVVRARCIGTKACVNAAPGTFAMDPVNVATVIDPAGDSEDDIVQAAEACPTGAVSVRRGDEKVV